MSINAAAPFYPTAQTQQTIEQQTPRQYQTELFLEARKRNVIAYLDTGSGKTLVSVLLIKDKASTLNVAGQKKVTVFLAPKVLLVQQQADVLRKHTSLQVSQYCGDMNVDYWDGHRWTKELREQDVWVMTPQILLNILRHGFIRINDINLLVCDECHRAVKKDPYNCIMQEFYHSVSADLRPHVFGMTASPVNTSTKQTQAKVSEAVWQLERNMDAQVITVIDRSPVVAAAPLPELKLLYYAREHETEALKEAQAGLAYAIWSLHRGETVMAQWAAARSQQAAQAASIGLQLDEEKLTSISAVVRRHLQGLALALQELGPWFATAILVELLKPRHGRNLLDQFCDTDDARITAGEPFADAIRKTPTAYAPPSKVTKSAEATSNTNETTATRHQDEDIELSEVAAVNKRTPLSPEVQAMNAGLREAASMLLKTLPVTRQRRKKIKEGLKALDPASYSFKQLLHQIVSDTLDAIPGQLIDLELGMPEAQLKSGNHSKSPQHPQQAEQAQQPMDTDQDQQAKQDNWDFTKEEAGSLRLPLFTGKVMAFVQYLLQYKGEVTASKLACYGSFEEAAKHQWSAILFVTRKMTSVGMNALFNAAPCLKTWRAAILMGYGGGLGAASITNKAQHHVLKKMKAGDLDIVISTAVAEEGLDVKQCQLVIRFDLPSTLLAFVQSRGRARAHGSHYVLMLEKDNRDHQLLLSQVVRYEANMRFHASQRPGLGTETDDEEEDKEPQTGPVDMAHIVMEEHEYRVESTGARVTLASAKALLYMFCAKLPADRYTVLRPRFSTDVLGEDAKLVGYQTSAILPNNSPVRIVQGQLMRTRALAQASASLEACKQLHQSGALDQNLLPDVTVFELDLDEDSDEEILFAKAMPVRKRKGAESLTDAIIDLNTYQVHLAAPDTRSNAKTIVLKPKVPDVLKPIPQPAESGMTTWLLYKFTITAKLGFMYHIPGPDEDPDDPTTNACPLDPVLENKLNMRAALPKQVFGMLVPKPLPNLRALLPYALSLPHAREALDCTFDFVGHVSYDEHQMAELQAFHTAMIVGPTKKKDAKNVAEELKKLNADARRALGVTKAQLDAAMALETETAGAQTDPDSATSAAAAASTAQTQQAQQASANPVDLNATSAQQAEHTCPEGSAESAESIQPVAITDATMVPTPTTNADNPDPTNSAQAISAAKAKNASSNAEDGAPEAVDKAGKLLEPTNGTVGPANADKAAAPDDAEKASEKPADVLEQEEEDRHSPNYLVVPLKLWSDWEVPDFTPEGCQLDIDWVTVRHVKHGWKPVTTPEQALYPSSTAEPTDTSHNMVIDSSNPCQASDILRTGPKLCPLPEYDLRSSVMVTTYSRTPYFYEGIEPHMTPESRFPTDKLKMQVVVEQEEEEEEFLPRPQKEKRQYRKRDDSIKLDPATEPVALADAIALSAKEHPPQATAPEPASVPATSPPSAPTHKAAPVNHLVTDQHTVSEQTPPPAAAAEPSDSVQPMEADEVDPALQSADLHRAPNTPPAPKADAQSGEVAQATVNHVTSDDAAPQQETDQAAFSQEQSIGKPPAELLSVGAKDQKTEQAAKEAVVEDSSERVVKLIATNQAASFAEYFKMRWNQEGLDPSQPLLRVTMANRRQDTPYEGGVFLVPQLCEWHPLKQQAFIMSKLIHQVLHYVRHLLLASELQPKLVRAPHRVPNVVYVLEAITPKVCQEIYSYERFELLGDAFLKYAVSLFLFHKFPEAHEGQLAGRKGAIVANANLVKVAIHKGLKHYMLAPLSRGKGAKKRAELGLTSVQQLKTKAWADIVESLIGLVYLEAGDNAAMEFLVYLGILPEVLVGFVEKPTTVIEELELDDAQLAADIAAAESAAAAMNLAEQQQQQSSNLALPAPETAPKPDTEMTDAKDTDHSKAVKNKNSAGVADSMPATTVVAGSSTSEPSNASAGIAGTAGVVSMTASAGPAGTACPAGQPQKASIMGLADSEDTADPASADTGNTSTCVEAGVVKSGMLGTGLADYVPAMWSGPILASARHNQTVKPQQGDANHAALKDKPADGSEKDITAVDEPAGVKAAITDASAGPATLPQPPVAKLQAGHKINSTAQQPNGIVEHGAKLTADNLGAHTKISQGDTKMTPVVVDSSASEEDFNPEVRSHGTDDEEDQFSSGGQHAQDSSGPVTWQHETTSNSMPVSESVVSDDISSMHSQPQKRLKQSGYAAQSGYGATSDDSELSDAESLQEPDGAAQVDLHEDIVADQPSTHDNATSACKEINNHTGGTAQLPNSAHSNGLAKHSLLLEQKASGSAAEAMCIDLPGVPIPVTVLDATTAQGSIAEAETAVAVTTTVKASDLTGSGNAAMNIKQATPQPGFPAAVKQLGTDMPGDSATMAVTEHKSEDRQATEDQKAEPSSADGGKKTLEAWKALHTPKALIDTYSTGLEAILKYQFKRRHLLQEALTHTSWPDANQQGYQRLEFLGDAVLDMLMTRFYFTAYRDSTPGTLSDLRSASVNNTRLASIAVLNRIHTYVRHCSSPLFHDIGAFVDQLQTAVSDQEKKIIAQQVELRRKQALARAAEAQEAGLEVLGGKQKASDDELNDQPAKRYRSSSPSSTGGPPEGPASTTQQPQLDGTSSEGPASTTQQPQLDGASAEGPASTLQQPQLDGTFPEGPASTLQQPQLDAALPDQDMATSPSTQDASNSTATGTFPSLTDATAPVVEPSTVAVTSVQAPPLRDHDAATVTDPVPSTSADGAMAAPAADVVASGPAAGDAKSVGGPNQQEVQLRPKGSQRQGEGGAPGPKARRRFQNMTRGKPREISLDEDARTAALQWASEAAFGSTEAAAPKILGDVIESLVGAVYLDTNHNFDLTWQIFKPLMSPLLSPDTVSKHPIRALHERVQMDSKLLRFICSISNPRAESISPMEEAELKRSRGEITTEQAALDAPQVLERQKVWQKQWRQRYERDGTLYDCIAVVDDIIIGRCIGATNKALAKRRAAEDGLRLIAEKEAADAAAAEKEAADAAAEEKEAAKAAAAERGTSGTVTAERGTAQAAAAETAVNQDAPAEGAAGEIQAPFAAVKNTTDDSRNFAAGCPASPVEVVQNGKAASDTISPSMLQLPLPQDDAKMTSTAAEEAPHASTDRHADDMYVKPAPQGKPVANGTLNYFPTRKAQTAANNHSLPPASSSGTIAKSNQPAATNQPYVTLGVASKPTVPAHANPPSADQLPDAVTAAALALHSTQPAAVSADTTSNGAAAMDIDSQPHAAPASQSVRETDRSTVVQDPAQLAHVALPAHKIAEASGWHADDMGIDDYAY